MGVPPRALANPWGFLSPGPLSKAPGPTVRFLCCVLVTGLRCPCKAEQVEEQCSASQLEHPRLPVRLRGKAPPLPKPARNQGLCFSEGPRTDPWGVHGQSGMAAAQDWRRSTAGPRPCARKCPRHIFPDDEMMVLPLIGAKAWSADFKCPHLGMKCWYC